MQRDTIMIGDCLKKKNTSAAGVPQAPAHPSNDPTPIEIPEKEEQIRENYFEKYAFNKTCAFEGSGINQVTDNFDGQGVSLGGLQWCVGQGSLQSKILKPYFTHNTPENYTESTLYSISNRSIKEGLALCKSNFLSGTKLKPEIRRDLEKFCIKAEKYQLLAAEEIFDKAWEYCRVHQMTSLKAFCFFFDVCVQNGSLNGVPKPAADEYAYEDFIKSEGGINKTLWLQSGPEDEKIILSLWIAKRAKQNQWRADVIARKCTIAHGVGYVHGKLHTFPEFN